LAAACGRSDSAISSAPLRSAAAAGRPPARGPNDGRRRGLLPPAPCISVGMGNAIAHRHVRKYPDAPTRTNCSRARIIFPSVEGAPRPHRHRSNLPPLNAGLTEGINNNSAAIKGSKSDKAWKKASCGRFLQLCQLMMQYTPVQTLLAFVRFAVFLPAFLPCVRGEESGWGGDKNKGNPKNKADGTDGAGMARRRCQCG
jgi:hypothetical protein